jgi:hypothetical protein
MYRRKFIVCCALTVAVAGCVNDSSDPAGNGDDGTDDGETENTADDSDDADDSGEDDGMEESSTYRLLINAPEDSAEDDDDVCYFDELPDDVQDEVEEAIEDADFEAEDPATFETDESPALLATDCYTQYIEYKDAYYWVEVEVESG